jgi:hypothetical protein
MNVCKRILAGVTLVLSSAGLLISLAAGVGVWVVKGPLTDRATHVFDRVEAKLVITEQGFDHVKSSLARAAERLDGAREEQRQLARQPQGFDVLRRKLARTVQQRIAPEVGDANEKLHTVAEAAVVVNAVLEDVGNVPFLSAAGLDLDRLAEMNRQLADVGPAAWELSRLLGEPGQDSDAGAQLSRVDHALKGMGRLIDEYEPQVAQVRQQKEALKAKFFRWVTPASVLVSLACVWIALSQISVLCHAWSWWEHSGSRKP